MTKRHPLDHVTTIRFSREDHQLLREEARDKDVSVSEIIRRVVGRHLKQKRKADQP
jgi:hypothetical protein